MTIRWLAPALAALLIAGPSPAGAPARADHASHVRIDRARIDRALAAMIADGRAAGVSALIWQDGREAYFGTAGMADREAGLPMTRATQVQLYSMTKPVTGVALMQLWEAGKFRLDDPLALYLPEFAHMHVAGKDGILRPASRPILIRDIMRHTAGFAYGSGTDPVDELFRRADPLGLDHDLAEMGRRVARLPLMFEPGTQWRYSVAVDVQALLVETLSGEPFEAYVRTHVLDPLRMTETGWTKPQDRLPRLAALYLRQPDRPLTRQADALTRQVNFAPRKLTPGGYGLVGPIDDYMRFARMLLAGGVLDGAHILKPSTIRLMATDQLDPAVTARYFLPGKGNVGFGLDFAVRVGPALAPAENRGTTGEFFWDGAASTLFWVDPANRLAAVFFAQTRPNDERLHRDFRRAVYGDDYNQAVEGGGVARP
ncbi:serine hydrolase domain-containing protein [Sphingomonas crusticola]|uniref:serine hydrolase domain-containing protein n=1 Tax=Sphingomonas crusticola TaxID=1697973 RepID=UPI000E276721|nr:serine hydrolase domain-containing protein [Sphingomonas crusticola]